MIYRVIGLMSGSSLDGLDVVFAEFKENAGKWEYQVLDADCYSYDESWKDRLKNATSLSAREYQLLHTEYGHYLGRMVNKFIDQNKFNYQVALIASHGHTTFHFPEKRMTAQLGDGAAIAAETGLPVVTDLRALDVALGGQGAPIVPIGEKLLLCGYDYFLNLGGIANITSTPRPPSPSGEGGVGNSYIAFDICPANKVLNLLASQVGKEYDENGQMASEGTVNENLLQKLNDLDYYKKTFPKSLANEFGTEILYPMIQDTGCEIRDALRTYVEHIAIQIRNSITLINPQPTGHDSRLLATGGGALNKFLINRIQDLLHELNIDVDVPDQMLINYKEALVMAFIGVLRWRQEYNVLSSVTGASRDSIGGALWTGQEA